MINYSPYWKILQRSSLRLSKSRGSPEAPRTSQHYWYRGFIGEGAVNCNQFLPTVPTFAVRETDVFGHNGGTSGAPLCRETLVSRTANVGTVGMNVLMHARKVVAATTPVRRTHSSCYRSKQQLIISI